MPTAAKLAAALCFAAVAYLAAVLFMPAMPEGTQFGQFLLICAAIGALSGWFVMGGSVGGGTSLAVGAGVKTAVVIVFWALLLFAIIEMVKLSMRLRYDGPMEAVLGVFALMMDYGLKMLSVEVLGTLFFGGMIGGALTEWVAARWR